MNDVLKSAIAAVDAAISAGAPAQGEAHGSYFPNHPRVRPIEAAAAKAASDAEIAEAKAAEGGVKFDQGKLPWQLLPFDALEQIVRVLQVGATIYDARNWERGMDWERPYGAALRHMTAWWRGRGLDPDIRLPHLACAATEILFLLAYELRGLGKDSRADHNETLPEEPAR